MVDFFTTLSSFLSTGEKKEEKGGEKRDARRGSESTRYDGVVKNIGVSSVYAYVVLCFLHRDVDDDLNPRGRTREGERDARARVGRFD